MSALHAIPGPGAGQPDFDALLAPLAPDMPCGLPIRHDAVFTEIRLLREEDDPSLPMGQWERPLKRADWARIEQLCSAVLATRSKDLQLAMWLAEAWTRQRGFGGLADGLRLVEALLRRYWHDLHPLPGEDGDSDARLAPLEWLNRSLGGGVRLHAALCVFGADKATPVTLALWERLTLQETAPAEPAARNAAPPATAPLTRAGIQAGAAELGPALAQTAAAVDACLALLGAIGALLVERVHDQAPSLGKLTGTLEAVLRVLSQLRPASLPGPDAALFSPPDDPDGHGVPGAGGVAFAGLEDADLAAGEPAREAGRELANAPPPQAGPGRWRNRREAYATLEALADYLGEVEPHSPTPFLIRRAANWGRMTLPEVVAEIIREEGDASRLFQVLGIKLEHKT